MTTNDHNLHDPCPEPGVTSDAPGVATAISAAPVDASSTDSEQPSRWGRGRWIAWLAARGAVYAVVAFAVALAAEILLEVARTGWQWQSLDRLYTQKSGVVWVGALVLLLVVGAVLSVTGRMWLTAPLVIGGVGVLGYASHLKWLARHEPIYPRDLVFIKEPQFLMTMVEPSTLWKAGLAVLGMLVLSWAVTWLFMKLVGARFGPKEKLTRPWRLGLLGVRLGVLVVCLLLLSSLTRFNHPDNQWRQAFEGAGAHWTKANQPKNYKHNGFVGAFLYNLDIPAMAKPADYSPATIKRIVQRYTAEANRHNAALPAGALADVNVVSILSESFSDFTRLEGIELREDPMPYTRELMERVPSGQMLSLKIGGGTSSMEFEVLTGMSLSQFNSALDTPYQMLVPNYRSFPSSVQTLKALGHTPLAIHPYRPSMYQRDTVYPILGFEDFTSKGEMGRRGRIENGRFMSDAAAYKEVLDRVEAHDEPVFVNLITMQNHVPYRGQYERRVRVEGLESQEARAMGQYNRGVSYTDKANELLIRRLEKSDEKTIVVFYGDHLPAGTPKKLFDNNSKRVMHETPFFIYKNFGKQKPEARPTTSPIFFLPNVFEEAGARITPYFALLNDLERHVSALEDGLLIGPDNEEIAQEDLSPEARRVLHDYRLIQYDLSVGKRYAAEMLRPDESPQNLSASGAEEQPAQRRSASGAGEQPAERR